ncbi:MAG: hypothetical protein ACRDPO_09570 [Streptosporangiaceae bacterium]
MSAELNPENAVRKIYDCSPRVARYAIDALVADGDTVAAAWTGTLPGGDEMRGLSLYQVSGGLIRWTRHALIGSLPPTGR